MLFVKCEHIHINERDSHLTELLYCEIHLWHYNNQLDIYTVYVRTRALCGVESLPIQNRSERGMKERAHDNLAVN